MTELTLDALNNSNITQLVYENLKDNILNLVKPFLALIGGLVGLYILYVIIAGILSYLSEKRIKKIYTNTEDIIRRLDKIEKIIEKKKKL